jgi:hypothetical protein
MVGVEFDLLGKNTDTVETIRISNNSQHQFTRSPNLLNVEGGHNGVLFPSMKHRVLPMMFNKVSECIETSFTEKGYVRASPLSVHVRALRVIDAPTLI